MQALRLILKEKDGKQHCLQFVDSKLVVEKKKEKKKKKKKKEEASEKGALKWRIEAPLNTLH